MSRVHVRVYIPPLELPRNGLNSSTKEVDKYYKVVNTEKEWKSRIGVNPLECR